MSWWSRLKYLFKDEVRALRTGARPARIVWFTVSPSPAPAWVCAAWALSPGIAWQLFARQTPFCVKNLTSSACPSQVWQYFTIVPDFKSVGVRDNDRVMRLACDSSVQSTRSDAMTATIERPALGAAGNA